MARIRSTKPEFWTSEQIVECSIDARLLFIGLWNFCDDGGVMKDSPRRIKMEVFPADDYTSTDIRRMLDELSANDLIQYFEVSNVSYIKVCGWHHQKIDRPNYKFPQPSGEIPTSKEHYLACQSISIRRTLDEPSPPEGSRREGNGRDTTTTINTREENSIQLSEFESQPRGIPISQWEVSPETPEALKTFGVPEGFIAEELQEFLFYWKDRDTPAESWDSKFYKRCLQQWKLNKHSWRPDHEAEEPSKSNQTAKGGKLSSIDRANAKTREYIASLGGGSDFDHPPDDGQALGAIDQ